MSWKYKVDKWQWGVALGVILPIIAFFLFWLWKFSDRSWSQLWDFMTLASAYRSNILVFPLIPNLLLFYFSNFLYRLDRFTVGLVGTTIVLAIPVLISLAI